MFTIGDFAAYGRVSVRMLRHYDALGLLRPARVDPASGYRFYEAVQFARLNRIIALKDLGFTLKQVRSVIDEAVSVEELRGMLRLRQAELRDAMAEAAARLAQVEARLRTIESEGTMPTEDVVVKRLPPLRLAELTDTAASHIPEDITPVIGPLFDRLCANLAEAGITPIGFGVARYEGDDSDEGAILVHAGMPVAAHTPPSEGWHVVDVPAVEQAATIVHRGSMDNVLTTLQRLARWIDDAGHRAVGYPREVTLAFSPDRDQWVTELQQPIAKA